MNDINENIREQEPQDPGVHAIQEPSTTVPDVKAVESRPSLQGFPLSDILRGFSTAFRSTSIQSMAVGWAAQISQEHEQLKQDHKTTRNELEDERIRVARLEERSDADRRVHTLTDFIKVVGGIIAGAATNFYETHMAFSIILFLLGIGMIGVGYLLGKPRT